MDGCRFRLVAFAVVCCILLLPACGNESAEQEPTDATEGLNAVVAEEAEGTEVVLTDNYSYVLPDGFAETPEEFEDFAKSTSCFYADGGKRQVRSWIVDDNYQFPAEVEAWAEDEGWKLGYGGLYDTAIAKATSTLDKDGETIYRTMFIWPDGPTIGCFIEIASYDEDYDDLTTAIRESIRCKNAPADTGVYGYHGEWTGTPSEEELDNAMMQDVQESMYEEYMHDMMEEDHGYPPHY